MFHHEDAYHVHHVTLHLPRTDLVFAYIFVPGSSNPWMLLVCGFCRVERGGESCWEGDMPNV